MLWLLSTFVTFSSFQGFYIAAQSTASCLPFYNWTSNVQNETPCQVASSLLSVCNNGPYPVLPLPVGSHYLGPTLQNANPCQCNTVTYSLMSACGACQGRTYLAWSVWSANCVMLYTDTYPEPLPSGVSVPGWAYLNIEAEDNFDQINARNNANLTASTALPSPTSSNVTSSKSSTLNKATSFTEVAPSTTGASTTTSTVISVPTTTEQPSFSSFSSAKANALGGGIVGGLFSISILFGLLYWYFHHRRKITRNGQQLASPTTSTHTSWPVQGQGPYMTQVAHTPAMPSVSSMGGAAYNLGSSVGSADSVPVGHAV